MLAGAFDGGVGFAVPDGQGLGAELPRVAADDAEFLETDAFAEELILLTNGDPEMRAMLRQLTRQALQRVLPAPPVGCVRSGVPRMSLAGSGPS